MLVKRSGTGAMLLAVVTLAAGLLAACTNDGNGESSQQIAELQSTSQQLLVQIQQLEEQLNAAAVVGPERTPTLIVKPLIFEFPKDTQTTLGDIWFVGSSLEPGQRFSITIDAEGSETIVGFDMERTANDQGSFAIGTAGVRPERFLGAQVEQRGGVFIVNLWDSETSTLLASTQFVVCGLDRANEWCEAAQASAIVPETVAVEGAGTVYNPDRFRIEDGFFQLRMGSEPYWGYNAGDRIDSTAGDGLVLTIKLGDTIKFNRLENRSGSGVVHHFTIADLGIDIEIAPDQRIEPFELKPDKAGEFVIDDSSDPGAHGKALLIVEE